MLKQYVIWITFAAYLLFLIGIALFERGRNHSASTRSFLTAGGSLKWPVLIMTYLASLMSTWVFFAGPGGYYRGGLGYWVSELSYIILFPVIAHFTMNKVWLLNHARGYTTPADFYHDRFRSPVLRVILALVFLVSSFPYITSVLVSIGQAAQVATGGKADYRMAIVIVGIAIIVYVCLGGMKSVAATDTIQGLLFISLLWVIALTCLTVGFDGSITGALDSIWENSREWFSYPGPDGWVPYGARLGYPLSCAIGWTIMLPHVFVRAGYSGKDMHTQRKLMALTPILQAVVWTGTMVIGLVGIALLPGLTSSDTELIIPYMIQNVIQSIHPTLAVVLMLIFFIGATAVGITTADSFLLVSSSIVYEDILHNTLGIELDERKRMVLIRVTIAIIGGISILLAINPPQLIYTLIMFAIAIVMPLFPILVCAIYWKRATKEAAVAAAIVGTVLVLMTYFVWNIGGTWYGAIGMLGSTITMVVVSLLTKPRPEDSKEFFAALEDSIEEFYSIEE